MNKSSGPRQGLETLCLGAFQTGLTHEVEAHAIDGTALIHRDPGSLILSGGGIGLVKKTSSGSHMVASHATRATVQRRKRCSGVRTRPHTPLSLRRGLRRVGRLCNCKDLRAVQYVVDTRFWTDTKADGLDGDVFEK